MIRSTSRRSAFTLIELLIVATIIAILVSLMAAGIFKAFGQLPKVQASSEIGNMFQGIEVFKTTFNLSDPPPSSITLCEKRTDWVVSFPNNLTPKHIREYRLFSQMFGTAWLRWPAYLDPPANTQPNPVWQIVDDWNGNGTPDAPYVLQGQQALVFYLGGIPVYGSGSISMSGFAAGNATPAALPAAGEKGRRGPFFPFQQTRTILAGMFPVYRDPYQKKGSPQVYAFFSTSGGSNGYNSADCVAIGAEPYYNAIQPNGVPMYFNQNGYQILCAGEDGLFGAETGGKVPGAVSWNPQSGQVGFLATPVLNSVGSPTGNDDQTNFSAGILKAGQQ